MQADIKVSFMGPQDIYESQATYAVCSNLYPSGRDADATDTWLAPPTIAIAPGDGQETPVEGIRKRRAILLRPFRPLPALRIERYQEVARAVSFRARSQHGVAKWHLNFSH
jgi:hypothetical protein